MGTKTSESRAKEVLGALVEWEVLNSLKPKNQDEARREKEAIVAKHIAEHAREALNERDRVLAMATKFAELINDLEAQTWFRCGIGRHPEEDKNWDREWMHIVYVDLPDGQVSWHIHDSELYLFAHLPPYVGEYDGHTTELKYRRLEQFGKRP
jgi:hypothetical protein